MKTKKNGFTLIELLVVIAIIGILASIVLVSFPQATKKAKDARVKSAIAQARTIMTSFYAVNGSYQNFSNTYSEMIPLATEVSKNCYGTAGLTIVVGTSANNYASTCMFAVLNEKNGATWYCADSLGFGGATSTDPGATAYCNTAGSYSCPQGLTD